MFTAVCYCTVEAIEELGLQPTSVVKRLFFEIIVLSIKCQINVRSHRAIFTYVVFATNSPNLKAVCSVISPVHTWTLDNIQRTTSGYCPHLLVHTCSSLQKSVSDVFIHVGSYSVWCSMIWGYRQSHNDGYTFISELHRLGRICNIRRTVLQ